MATLEREVTSSAAPSLRLTPAQMTTLRHAAAAEGQTLDEFMVSALLRAADAILTPPPLATKIDPLDRVAGIFKDEPLMEELMERIREDRRREIALFRAEELRDELENAPKGN